MNYDTITSEENWNKYFLDELRRKGFDNGEYNWKNINNTYRFVHFSPNIDHILKSGKINISGGGLFGVIYVTPVHSNGLVHNLGQYISEIEIPQSLNKSTDDCLIFELTEKQYISSLSKGKINYILESTYYTKTKSDPEMVSLCSKALNDIDYIITLDMNNFFKEITTFFNKYSALKHVYFESINEYLYTRQDSKTSLRYLKMGEVYAREIKNYLFKMTPKLKTSFSTTHFVTDTSIHIYNLKNQKQIISNFNADDFLLFMYSRVKFYFTELRKNQKALLGRFILKNTPTHFRDEIEQRGVDLFIRKKEGMILLQYDTIPKGEMGILPSNKITTYKAKYIDGIVKLNNKVKIDILPTLISNNQSVLRVK